MSLEARLLSVCWQRGLSGDTAEAACKARVGLSAGLLYTGSDERLPHCLIFPTVTAPYLPFPVTMLTAFNDENSPGVI